MNCTFIGHRMVPSEIQASLEAAVIGVIKKGVKSFYIGNHGDFDKMATKVLKKLSVSFPQIKYATVLAYMPTTQQENTVFPEGLETVHPKSAIEKRNLWMIENSDVVITYITREGGCAAKFKAMALRKGKEIISIK